MNPDDITVVLLTYNEAANIERTLDSLTWARQIVVVDSFSTDDTCDRAKRYPTVRVIQRAFDNFANQCNYGLTHAETEWVLSLDSDYGIPAGFIEELRHLEAGSTAAFQARFRYCVFGQPLRASLYPPRAVLFRKALCFYVEDGHTQLLKVEGIPRFLETSLDHDDRKPIERWFSEQIRYSALEARKLAGTPWRQLSWADRVRRTIFLGPVLVFFYTLLWKGLIFDGRRGWHYVLQRTLAEGLLSIRLLELKLTRTSPGKPGPSDRGLRD